MKIDEADMQAARAIVSELKTFVTDEDLKRVAQYVARIRATARADGAVRAVKEIFR